MPRDYGVASGGGWRQEQVHDQWQGGDQQEGFGSVLLGAAEHQQSELFDYAGSHHQGAEHETGRGIYIYIYIHNRKFVVLIGIRIDLVDGRGSGRNGNVRVEARRNAKVVKEQGHQDEGDQFGNTHNVTCV